MLMVGHHLQVVQTMLLEEPLQTMSQYFEKLHQKSSKKVFMDDLLKSLKDVESAKELVKDVMKMCKVSGFQCTKLISNNK